MSKVQTAAPVGTILLQPRPYARGSGVLILVPLISKSGRTRTMLPAETWSRVLAFVFAAPPGDVPPEERQARAGLLRVSRTFKVRHLAQQSASLLGGSRALARAARGAVSNLVSPLFYAYPHLRTLETLGLFAGILRTSERAWDSLRRIPYSTPGRWVQALDLSRIGGSEPAERLAVDTLLTFLFPLTPFLSRLVLNGTVKLSRRAVAALVAREGASRLTVLKGVSWDGASALDETREDPLLELVRASEGLEELELSGPGLQDDEAGVPPTSVVVPVRSLHLPNLHSLTILQLPKSTLIEGLVHSSLPSLRHLNVTPYDDVSWALTSALVAAHGAKLHTLAFSGPKTWPPTLHETRPDVFRTAPSLRVMALTIPLPMLSDPPCPHPLRVLSLPRPDSEYLYNLEVWLELGLLPHMEEVHMRTVRWVRAGLTRHACEAGTQGEMNEWKRQLARWNIRITDACGKENEA